MAYTSAIVSVLSTAYSVDQQKSSERKRRRANQVQRNQQTVEDRRSRSQAQREDRIRRARILNRAEAAGMGESSGVMGGLGSMTSQLGSAFAAQSGQALSADTITSLNNSAATNIFNAQMAEGFNNIFQAGVGAYGSGGGKPKTDYGEPGGMSKVDSWANNPLDI